MYKRQGQTHSGRHKDALGSLARRHLKDLILPDGDAVRLLPFNGAEQQIPVSYTHLDVYKRQQHAHGQKLTAQVPDVIAEDAGIGVHIGGFGEGVQAALGEQLSLIHI